MINKQDFHQILQNYFSITTFPSELLPLDDNMWFRYTNQINSNLTVQTSYFWLESCLQLSSCPDVI